MRARQDSLILGRSLVSYDDHAKIGVPRHYDFHTGSARMTGKPEQEHYFRLADIRELSVLEPSWLVRPRPGQPIQRVVEAL